MLETEKIDSYAPPPAKEKKINLVPILISALAVLIVVASAFTVYTVLTENEAPKKSENTSQTSATPSATLQEDEDFQEAESAIDSVDPNSLDSDLDKNDQDAASF